MAGGLGLSLSCLSWSVPNPFGLPPPLRPLSLSAGSQDSGLGRQTGLAGQPGGEEGQCLGFTGALQAPVTCHRKLPSSSPCLLLCLLWSSGLDSNCPCTRLLSKGKLSHLHPLTLTVTFAWNAPLPLSGQLHSLPVSSSCLTSSTTPPSPKPSSQLHKHWCSVLP